MSRAEGFLLRRPAPPPAFLIFKTDQTNMDTTSNETPGGSAAQTPNSNPQPEFLLDVTSEQHAAVISPQFVSDDPISLREISEAFKCSVHSLKDNVKSGRLPSLKAAATAPYLVKPSIAEKFLRATPTVRSIFHPGAGAGKKSPLRWFPTSLRRLKPPWRNRRRPLLPAPNRRPKPAKQLRILFLPWPPCPR